MSALDPAASRDGHGLSAASETIAPVEPRWSIAPARNEETARLAREAGLPPLAARLLLTRGIATAQEAREFLEPDVSRLHDPLLLSGAEEAAEILVSAARAGHRIVVFGDYDVDGVTAAAQLRAALRRAGGDAVAFIPHRLRDGYGLKPETVRAVLRDFSPRVLITVDCGITAADGVACAREAGVTVIVTDHHLVPERLPPGAVVVNPRQPGCPYPYKDLAASGIALKLAEAVARRAGVALSRESLLRLACLGTIADLVPLTGENRVIAAAGLAALASPRAPGLKALLAEAGVAAGQPPTSEEVAFRIAPRLNATGRVDTAELALALFEERDPERAASLARQLTLLNAERQSLERRVTAQARERIARGHDPEREAVLIEADAAWHRGVLGIAASRLAREYHRPVLLFGLEGGRASGSGRSIPGVSLHAILTEISDLFTEFGGHDQAVGGTLAAERLPELREAARALFAARVPREKLVRVEEADAELPLEEVTGELLGHLSRFEPHGMGNRRPVFYCGAARAAGSFVPLGERGLRGRLRAGARDLSCVCWEGSEALQGLLERGSGGAPRTPESGGGTLRSPQTPRGGGAFQIQYRLSRNRYGEPEAEILRARP